MSVLLRAFAVFFVIVVVETVHGILRVAFLEPLVGDFRARQLAVFTGSALILLIAIAFIRWIRPASARQCLAVGLLWLALIVGFEILLGRLMAGYSWERILSDYDLRKGGLLPIGLVVLTAAPFVAARIRPPR